LGFSSCFLSIIRYVTQAFMYRRTPTAVTALCILSAAPCWTTRPNAVTSVILADGTVDPSTVEIQEERKDELSSVQIMHHADSYLQTMQTVRETIAAGHKRASAALVDPALEDLLTRKREEAERARKAYKAVKAEVTQLEEKILKPKKDAADRAWDDWHAAAEQAVAAKRNYAAVKKKYDAVGPKEKANLEGELQAAAEAERIAVANQKTTEKAQKAAKEEYEAAQKELEAPERKKRKSTEKAKVDLKCSSQPSTADCTRCETQLNLRGEHDPCFDPDTQFAVKDPIKCNEKWDSCRDHAFELLKACAEASKARELMNLLKEIPSGVWSVWGEPTLFQSAMTFKNYCWLPISFAREGAEAIRSRPGSMLMATKDLDIEFWASGSDTDYSTGPYLLTKPEQVAAEMKADLEAKAKSEGDPTKKKQFEETLSGIEEYALFPS